MRKILRECLLNQAAISVRATFDLCVKRERPLIIAYSLYSENIMHSHFYLNTLEEENRGAQAEKLALSQL